MTKESDPKIQTPEIQNPKIQDPEIQATQELTGPNGMFELTKEMVFGEEMEVFVNRMKSLRELAAYSANFKDREFMVMDNRRHTFQSFLDLVSAYAEALKTDFNIQKGDRIGIFAANSPEWSITFFAAVSIGAIVAAYNGRWKTSEILYGLEHSQPKLLVSDQKRLERLADQNLPKDMKILNLDKQFHNATSRAPELGLPDDEIDEDDPCLILYTSGTTGKPKGATISHRGLIGFVQTTLCNAIIRSRALELAGVQMPPRPEQSITIGTSPLFHVSGLHATLLLSIATGGKIIYRPGRFDPKDILQTIEREKVTQFSALGNSGWQIARHPETHKYDLSSIQNAGFGGAPASPALQQLIRETFPNAANSVGMGYGSSETTAVVSTIGGTEYMERPESCGQPGIGMEVEIRDSDGNVLPPEVQGEIHCRSAYTMLEYWQDTEATSQTIKSGRWLATGDIGYLCKDNYLYINSRARDMILSKGENIYPIEIEYILDSHPNIAESAVLGVDHPENGQDVMAFVVPANPDQELHVDDLISFTKESLADYKVPTIWEIHKNPLPRNAAGKIQKLELMPD